MENGKAYYVIRESHDGYYKVVAKATSEHIGWRIAYEMIEQDKEHMYFVDDEATIIDALTHGVLPFTNLNELEMVEK